MIRHSNCNHPDGFMAQGPKERDIATQALHAVSDVISDADSTPEKIVSPRGESHLLVQTSHKHQMDASRLWVQIKGTDKMNRYRLKSGGYRLSIPFDHAMRWIRTLDLVVVVLWDVAENVGWYTIPAGQVDPIAGVNSGQKSVTIRFAENDIFEKEAVDRLAWQSRLEHYRLLALSARDAQSVGEQLEKHPAHERVLAAMDFTDLLGITERRLKPGDLKYKVRADIWGEFQEILGTIPEKKGEDMNTLLEKVAYAVVRRRWEMIEPKLALPSVLIEEGGEVILFTLRAATEDREMMQAAEALATAQRASKL